jgi:hypothetical protein
VTADALAVINDKAVIGVLFAGDMGFKLIGFLSLTGVNIKLRGMVLTTNELMNTKEKSNSCSRSFVAKMLTDIDWIWVCGCGVMGYLVCVAGGANGIHVFSNLMFMLAHAHYGESMGWWQ